MLPINRESIMLVRFAPGRLIERAGDPQGIQAGHAEQAEEVEHAEQAEQAEHESQAGQAAQCD